MTEMPSTPGSKRTASAPFVSQPSISPLPMPSEYVCSVTLRVGCPHPYHSQPPSYWPSPSSIQWYIQEKWSAWLIQTVFRPTGPLVNPRDAPRQ